VKAILKLLLAAMSIGGGASAAQAQESPAPAPPPPPNPGLMGENPVARNGGDSYERDMDRARDNAAAANRGGGRRAARTVPAKPEEVIAGREVRDSRGVRIGSIESVTMSAAVLKADGGAVDVPLEAFGKDGKGLLIAMTKADFDKLVAGANKPQ
jgi:hypothetical protein